MAWNNTPDEVKALREKIKLSPDGAYVFWGEEEYLKGYYLDELKEIVVSEGLADFNRSVIDFDRDGSVEEIIEGLNTLPVMASHKIIEVWALNLFEIKEEAKKKLMSALEEIDEGVIVVFYIRATENTATSKKTREKAIYKALSQVATVVEFPRQSEARLLSWVDKQFTTREVRISDVNIGKMIRLCDYSMTRLKSESDKIISYCKQNALQSVPNDLVEKMVSPSAENAMWELSDAISRRSRKDAFEIFENLKGQGVESIVILSVIAKAITNLMLLKSGDTDTVSAEKMTGLSPFQIKNLRRELYRFEKDELKSALDRAVACESELKLLRAPDYLLVEAYLSTLFGEAK